MIITKKSQFDQVRTALQSCKSFAIDFETDGLDWWTGAIFAVGLYNGKDSFYIPFNTLDDKRRDNQIDMFISFDKHEITVQDFGIEFNYILSNPKYAKIGSNLKFDISWAEYNGIHIKGPLLDTFQMEHLLNESDVSRNGLDYLSEKYLDKKKLSYKELTKTTPYWRLSDKVAAEYCIDDVVTAFDIFYIQLALFVEDDLPYELYTQEAKIIEVLRWMEMNGIKIDVEHAQKFVIDYRAKVEFNSNTVIDILQKVAKTDSLKESVGALNLSSPKQVKELLIERMKFPDLNNGSVDKHTWKKWQYSNDQNMVDIGQAMRNYSKAVSNLKFVDPTKPKSILARINKINGKVHPGFHNATTVQRFSCKNPNFQNLPREEKAIRGCIIPSDGFVFYNPDYSQIELRFIAHYSKDSNMMKAFDPKSKVDIHEITRKVIENYLETDDPIEQRTIAKGVNFGIWYGLSAPALADTLNVKQDVAIRIINSTFDTYPEAKQWVENVKKWIVNKQYVQNIFGAKRRFFDIDFDTISDKKREFLLREGVHFLPCSSAAGLIKVAMIRLYNEYAEEDNVRLVLQVHDELLFEIREEIIHEVVPRINEIMNQPIKRIKLRVPIEVEGKILYRWGK